MDEVNIDELIARAREHVSKPVTVSQEVSVGDELVEVTFAKIDGMDWASLAVDHPPRPNSKIDRVGHNVDALPRDYPAESITVGGEKVTAEQWQSIFDTLEAPFLRAIGAAVWGLNDLDVVKRANELKKASAVVSKKKLSSPAN